MSIIFPQRISLFATKEENIGLFTRYKNNFKKQVCWIWGYKFVYSHSNSKHLEFSLCFPLISAALLEAQAPSPEWIFLKKGRHVPGSVLAVCAHQPILPWGAAVKSRGDWVSPSARRTLRRVLGTSVMFLLIKFYNNGQCQHVSLVSSWHRGCFIQLSMVKTWKVYCQAPGYMEPQLKII